MTNFSIAQTRSKRWVWKLVHYTHVYHRSPSFKTEAGCRKNLFKFINHFNLAMHQPIYPCKALQADPLGEVDA